MVHARSRVILNSYSRLWEFPLALAQRLGLAELPRPADASDALAVALCHLQGAALLERLEAAR